MSLNKESDLSLYASSDRGNDNWLIKYEKPGDGELAEKVSCGIFIVCSVCSAGKFKVKRCD